MTTQPREAWQTTLHLLIAEQFSVIAGQLDRVQISTCRGQVPAAPQAWQAEAGLPQCQLWCVGAMGAGCRRAQASLEHTEDGAQEPTTATSRWIWTHITVDMVPTSLSSSPCKGQPLTLLSFEQTSMPFTARRHGISVSHLETQFSVDQQSLVH